MCLFSTLIWLSVAVGFKVVDIAFHTILLRDFACMRALLKQGLVERLVDLLGTTLLVYLSVINI